MTDKLKKYYSFVLFPVYAVVFFVIVMAAVSPLGGGSCYDIDGSTPAFSAAAGEEKSLNDCKTVGGCYIADGDDPFVVFDCAGYDILMFRAEFSPDRSDAAVKVYYDTGEGFNERETCTVFVSDAQSQLSYPMNKNIRRLRFDFSHKLKIEKIDFYSEIKTVGADAPSRGANRFAVLTVGIVLAGLFTFAEYKSGFILKILSAVKNNIKPILLFSSGICASALLAGAAALLFIKDKQFNFFLFVFFFALSALVFEVVFFSKTVVRKTERLFLAICLTLGFMMIFATPVGHVSWDDGVHYKYALSTTSPKTEYSVADAAVMKISPVSNPEENLSANIQRNIFLNGQDEYYGGELGFSLNIPHFCSGVTVKFLRYIGFSFFSAFVLGKIPNLLIYAFVCYFAVKKLNSGKMLLSVIALFPTCLFLASNYSYDYWVIAFSFLGAAYYYSEVQKPGNPISGRDTLVMCGAFLLAAIPKAVYLTLLIIPLCMRREKISDRKKYYLTCVSAFIILAILLFIKARSSVSGSGDIRGGENINPSAQLAGIFARPFAYAWVLIKFLIKYFWVGNMREYISCFAGIGMTGSAPVFICLVVILALTDRNGYDIKTANLKEKAVALIVLTVTSAMIATALYIDFTPVGLDTVNGCQQRYLLPLIFPVFYAVGSFKKRIKLSEKNKKIMYLASFGLCSAVVSVDFYTLILTKML